MTGDAHAAALVVALLVIAAAMPRSTDDSPVLTGGRVTLAQIGALAARAIAETGAGWPVDRRMIAAMVEIESGRDPAARRFEAGLGESSLGLMQVLPSTARDLYGRGYQAAGYPTEALLLSPWGSIYFGTAYVRWLSRYAGRSRSAEWIVQSYNGGPGNSNAQTRNHWTKYQRARNRLVQEGF